MDGIDGPGVGDVGDGVPGHRQELDHHKPARGIVESVEA